MITLVVVLSYWAVILPLDRWFPAAKSSIESLAGSESSCTTALTTTLRPNPQSICEPLDITTTFTAACPACPEGVNVVFIMDGTPFPDWEEQVALQALSVLQRYEHSSGKKVSVGVLHYDDRAVRVALSPTLNLATARGALTSFGHKNVPRGVFMSAAQRALAMISEGRRLHNGQSDPECEFVIFFLYTKSYYEDKGNEMIMAGRTILRAVPNLYVGCPQQDTDKCEVWEPRVPKSPRYYTRDPEATKLRGMVIRGLRDVDRKGLVSMRSLSTDQWIPKDLEVLSSSFSLRPTEVATDTGATRLTWKWQASQLTEPMTLTFRVQPRAAGEWQSKVVNEWRDSKNGTGREEVLSERFSVYDEICETPTPTLTPLPSPTPTASATFEPSPTPAVTETPVPSTVTPRPRPIYLPIAVRERCVPEEVHADVVLVIDVSTSMLRLTRTGRTKLAATQDAAKQFVSFMDLAVPEGEPHDQVGLVGFNREAWIQTPLGSDLKQVHAGIDALSERVAELTRLDLAFEVGAQAILEGPRLPANTPVIILLTDGLPNQVPYAEDGTVETTVLRAAAAAKDSGISVFTIAIGEVSDTNPELLVGCASGEDQFYYTLDPEDLAEIYMAIAYSIDCPLSQFWGQH
jgi:Mg-chelatase subunit ChlD